MLDFSQLHPTAWAYWQAIDWRGWGLWDGNVTVGTIGAPTQKYFALAHFTRHIRPGMMILDGGSNCTVAAWDPSAEKLIIVAMNSGTNANNLSFDLSRFSIPGVDGGAVPRWCSDNLGGRYVLHRDTFISGRQFQSFFAPGMIQTFEVSGVQV